MKLERKCGTCHFFDAETKPNGDRKTHGLSMCDCHAPLPEFPAVPASWKWSQPDPNQRPMTCADYGTDCPAWRAFK
jgi:hypothetical protein